jgi:hypothetical protein
MTARGSRYLVPISAALAVGLSSTALSGVLRGYAWLWPVLIAIGVVTAIGLVVRAIGLPTMIAVPLQTVGLALLVVALFGEHRVMGVLPGAGTLAGLGEQLASSLDQIQSGIPPVVTTEPLMLLVVLGFGVVMLIADPLVMAGFGPVACGLVILGGYTVPTALSPDPLPRWALVLCGAGYAAHLMVWQRERLARRGILASRPPDPPGATASERVLQRLASVRRAATGASLTSMLTAVGLAFAIGVSSMATFIGTDGRFPGQGHGHSNTVGTEFGLNPFTTLRGELSKSEPKELFRVRGMPSPEYLRALTLTHYVPQEGWELPQRRSDAAMDSTLPSGIGVPVNNPTATIQIQNMNYRDRWLPLVGLPMGVAGLIPGRWHYDVISNTAYSAEPISEPAWTERAGLPDPNVAALVQTELTQDVDPAFLSTSGVDPRITRLAQSITRGASSPFGKAVALNRFFLDPSNGYRYDTRTAAGSSGDALVDFLFWSKVGYCEQYASAMAVMLRSLGIPARVAVGFTPGKETGDYRSITTDDAHAWAEGYFSGVGWLTFDSTPTGDGRTILPSYVANAPDSPSKVPPSVLAAGQPPNAPRPGQNGPPNPQGDQTGGTDPGQKQTPGQSQTGANEATPGGESASQGGSVASGGGAGGDSSGGGQQDDKKDDGSLVPGLALTGIALLVLLTLLGLIALVAIAATPHSARAIARHRRMVNAARGGSSGAEAAWRELLAEFQDRGADPGSNETVRRSARNLAKTYQLDESAVGGVQTVVVAVEHGRYAPPDFAPPAEDLVSAVDVVRTSLATHSPLSMRAWLWPRSIMSRQAWAQALLRRLDRLRGRA